MGRAQDALGRAQGAVAAARARLEAGTRARDGGIITDAKAEMARMADEVARLGPPAYREQQEAARAVWAGIEAARVADYRIAANRLLDAIDTAEAAVVAVAEAAAEVAALATAHRTDTRRPRDDDDGQWRPRFGDPYGVASDGTAMRIVQPSACVMSVAAVGLAEGDASRAFPQFLDQAQAIRSALVLPTRTQSNPEES